MARDVHKVGPVDDWGRTNMLEPNASKHDQRSVSIFAKSIYRELRTSGFNESDVMNLAGELLALLTRDVKSQAPQSPSG
jgi:hypothetical protein